MHRLFVAVSPPASIRAQLLTLAGGVQNARWQDEDQLHLTLRFIGELDRHRAEDIAASLGSIRHDPFEVALHGVGSFMNRGKGALWAGLAPHGELKALHKKVDQACLRVGIEPDNRAYLPHITVARLGRGAGPVEPFVERWAGLSSPSFRVDNFRLYESRLGSAGPSYTAVALYPLG